MKPASHNDNSRPESPPRRASHGRPRVRLPLSERKLLQRRDARLLIARRTRKPPTAAQLAFDPLARPAHRPARRRIRLTAAIIGSLLVHAGAIAIGIAMKAGVIGPRRDQVTIEMRQKPPEPPPPEKKPEPPVPVEKPTRPQPKVAKLPPPPATPPPPTKAAPVRIVGLSLESTSGEGGDGPTFAVGNTRLGETEKKASAPKALPPAPEAPTPPPGPARSNAVASHIPVAGVKYEKPKPKHTPKPPYPPDLQAQGIEGDVPVILLLDASGKVTKVTIVKESPYPAFNEAARATAMTYEYEPATRDGVPMPTTLPFIIKFRLEEND